MAGSFYAGQSPDDAERLLQVDGAQVISLAKLDPGLAQQGIGHGEVEVEVGDAVLMHAGVAVHPLATGPVGVVVAARILAEIGIQLALQISEGLGQVGAQIRHGLGVIPQYRRLAQAGGGHHGAGAVAADQHLLAEWQHVDDQPIAKEVLHIEFLGGGVGLGLGQALVEVSQHLDKLGDDITIHNALSVG